MSLADWIIGVPIALAILYYLLVGIWTTVTELIPFVYRTFKYERHGICPECKQPYERRQVSLADQMYGPAATYQDVCPNGHVGMRHGNRRFAEW